MYLSQWFIFRRDSLDTGKVLEYLVVLTDQRNPDTIWTYPSPVGREESRGRPDFQCGPEERY